MKLLHQILQLCVALSVPFIILMFSVLILFQPWFLTFEYQRDSFPLDPYGFTQEERLDYGIKSIRYIIQNEPVEYLSKIQYLDDSGRIYTEREVSHMQDVQHVFQIAKTIFGVLVLLIVALLLTSYSHPARLESILKGITMGSFLSILLLILIIFCVVFAFDTLFDTFHRLFFSEGTWLFYINDTLIRLFPGKLWMDAFLFAGILSFVLSFIVLIFSKRFYETIRIRKPQEHMK